jgi:hypothetical protein
LPPGLGGSPGSNYSLASLSQLAERCRQTQSATLAGCFQGRFPSILFNGDSNEHDLDRRLDVAQLLRGDARQWLGAEDGDDPRRCPVRRCARRSSLVGALTAVPAESDQLGRCRS